MALTAEEIDHVLALFSGVSNLFTRKMFGGMCLYLDGEVFALMSMERWTYQRPGKAETALPYWIMPDSALEDSEEASALAREALQHL